MWKDIGTMADFKVKVEEVSSHHENTARYSCSPANKEQWQLSQFFLDLGYERKGAGFSFPRRPLSCQSKTEKQLQQGLI